MRHEWITTKKRDGRRVSTDGQASVALQRNLLRRLRSRQSHQSPPLASLSRASWSPEVIKETRFSAILYR